MEEKEMKNAVIFMCKYCGKEFDSPRKMAGHIAHNHSDEAYNDKVRMPVRRSNLYTTLDITKKELDEYRSSHSNTCDICGKIETANTRAKYKDTPNRLCIDHDHKTSRFRGFLCVQCNRNLGWYDKYKDSIERHYNFENAPEFLSQRKK